jgi:hypothetical protein
MVVTNTKGKFPAIGEPLATTDNDSLERKKKVDGKQGTKHRSVEVRGFRSRSYESVSHETRCRNEQQF